MPSSLGRLHFPHLAADAVLCSSLCGSLLGSPSCLSPWLTALSHRRENPPHLSPLSLAAPGNSLKVVSWATLFISRALHFPGISVLFCSVSCVLSTVNFLCLVHLCYCFWKLSLVPATSGQEAEVATHHFCTETPGAVSVTLEQLS